MMPRLTELTPRMAGVTSAHVFSFKGETYLTTSTKAGERAFFKVPNFESDPVYRLVGRGLPRGIKVGELGVGLPPEDRAVLAQVFESGFEKTTALEIAEMRAVIRAQARHQHQTDARASVEGARALPQATGGERPTNTIRSWEVPRA